MPGSPEGILLQTHRRVGRHKRGVQNRAVLRAVERWAGEDFSEAAEGSELARQCSSSAVLAETEIGRSWVDFG